jgi:hypothetical protein
MLRATVLKPRRAEIKLNTVVLIKIVHTIKKDADLKTSQMCLSQPLNKNTGRYIIFYYSRFSNFVALFAVAARFTISGQI